MSSAAVSWTVPSAPRVGLWLFMAVVSALFGLFAIAYLMRMVADDWRALPSVPWQLWLSTALLATSSVAWQLASRAAARGDPAAVRRAWLAACGCALLFLAVQLWAWQALTAQRYTVDANPANSFFYLLTGLHGLHVAGGLAAAALVGAGLLRRRPLAQAADGIALCARYWHFLLALWLAVFGLLFLVTPAFVQAVCNSVLPQ